MSTWWMDCKNIYKKKKNSRGLFEIIHIIHFEIWDLRSRDLKKILGYDINYLSIWPFMRHPWFPTRKASKLIFVCFQLAGEWHHPASWKQSHGHHPVFIRAAALKCGTKVTFRSSGDNCKCKQYSWNLNNSFFHKLYLLDNYYQNCFQNCLSMYIFLWSFPHSTWKKEPWID